MAEVVVISDTDSEPSNCIAISPLTSIKPKPNKSSSSAKRPLKRLVKSSKIPKNQTKLNNFFQTLTIRSEKTNRSPTKTELNVLSKASTPGTLELELSDNFIDNLNKPCTSLENMKPQTSLKDMKLSPLKASKAVKRSAVKGLSPQAKTKPKLTELKGGWHFMIKMRVIQLLLLLYGETCCHCFLITIWVSD